MLEEYGEVNHLPDINFTDLRRGMEPKVQSNHTMKTRSKDVSNHSEQTGSKYYDQSRSGFRSASMYHINKLEGSKEVDYEDEDEGNDETVNKRAKLDDEEYEESVNQAKERLRSSAPRKIPINSRCNLVPENRLFIQEEFSAGGKYAEVFSSFDVFPGKKFYR